MQEFRATPDGDLKLVIASASDVGCIRENNEDAIGCFAGDDPSHGYLLMVCDGMGGAAAGEVASNLAVETVRDRYFEAAGERQPRAALRHAIELANQTIYQRAEDDPRLGGMGTTCTAAVIVGLDVLVGHVGDSRAYLVQDTRLIQITRDHSLAAELERRIAPGDPTPQAGRNVLTRCLGVSPSVQVDITDEPLRLQAEYALVLCSDGLSNMVSSEEILHTVWMHLPDEACRRLIELARKRGGPDNITVQVARLRKC